MLIRRYKPADIDAILQLFYDTVHAVGAKYYTPEQLNAWAPGQVDQEKIARWQASLERNVAFVAEIEGILVGFADMSPEGYLDRMYVHKDYQARGIALALLKALEDEARRLGIKELTTDASVIIKPLAERRGYQVVEVYKKVHRGVEFVNYKMRKKLDDV